MNRRQLQNLKNIASCLKEVIEIVEIISDLEEAEQKRVRRYAVRPVNRDRTVAGFFEVSFLKFREIDPEQFFIYTRMTADQYAMLLSFFKPLATKVAFNDPVSAECRLAVLLLYLSQGSTIQQLAWQFKLGKETVRQIVLESAAVLWENLSSIYVSPPNESDYAEIRNDYWHMWDMPNCIGAIDGKHIAIQCPCNSGSQYYNYKSFYSIVLMAACDAKYRFTHIDLGAYGSQSDGGIFQHSKFGKKVLDGSLPMPCGQPLPSSEEDFPNFFVGDAAFPLALHILRPYPGRNLPQAKEYFNKRLSRARRTIENAFGILVARWRVLSKPINMIPENVEKVVLACVLLHNFIMLNNEVATSSYCPRLYVDEELENGDIRPGLWRGEVPQLPSISSSRNQHHFGGSTALRNRDALCAFLSTTGIAGLTTEEPNV